MTERITQKDINRIVNEVTVKFIKENQEEILRRARKQLEAEFPKKDEKEG